MAEVAPKRSRSLPARYPPAGAWPAQMRADMVAAYLDFHDTTELAAAIRAGQAPPPSSLRGVGRNREPVWARADLDRHIAPDSLRREDSRSRENLQSLV